YFLLSYVEPLLPSSNLISKQHHLVLLLLYYNSYLKSLKALRQMFSLSTLQAQFHLMEGASTFEHLHPIQKYFVTHHHQKFPSYFEPIDEDHIVDQSILLLTLNSDLHL